MLDPRVILGQKPRKQALKAPIYFFWAGERDHAPYHAQEPQAVANVCQQSSKAIAKRYKEFGPQQLNQPMT